MFCSFLTAFNSFIVVRRLIWANNEGRSVFDNGFADREEMGCQASNIGVSEQEMVLIKSYQWLK